MQINKLTGAMNTVQVTKEFVKKQKKDKLGVLGKQTTKNLNSFCNSPTQNPYHDDAYDLQNPDRIRVGLSKVNTAFKGEGCEAGRGFIPLNQIEKERAAQVARMWKKPVKPKTFEELKKIDSHQKREYFDDILFQDAKRDAYLENQKIQIAKL